MENQQEAYEYDIFISHSSKDKEFVKDLDLRLRRVGMKCFLDEREIGGGESIVEEVSRGINTSRKVLLVYSPDFFLPIGQKANIVDC